MPAWNKHKWYSTNVLYAVTWLTSDWLKVTWSAIAQIRWVIAQAEEVVGGRDRLVVYIQDSILWGGGQWERLIHGPPRHTPEEGKGLIERGVGTGYWWCASVANSCHSWLNKNQFHWTRLMPLKVLPISSPGLLDAPATHQMRWRDTRPQRGHTWERQEQHPVKPAVFPGEESGSVTNTAHVCS